MIANLKHREYGISFHSIWNSGTHGGKNNKFPDFFVPDLILYFQNT
jgi:hypothetical protein